MFWTFNVLKTFPRLHQKIVIDSLKKNIKSKVKLHKKVIDDKGLDILIDAVDKKIDRSKRIWKKRTLILLMK